MSNDRDGVSLFQDLTGLSRPTIHDIWDEVKENHARLEGCPGPHDFQNEDAKRTGRAWRCTQCRGTVDCAAALWYGRGRDHGRH